MTPDPRRDDGLPPDPWAEEGIDLWALEQADRLTREEADPSSSQWDELEGPTIDDFDRAGEELTGESGLQGEGSGLLGALRPWLGAIALIVVLAFILTYAIR